MIYFQGNDRKVTVMELLREEYERDKSQSGPSSLHGSPVHCHRAASDTDIIRSAADHDALTVNSGNCRLFFVIERPAFQQRVPQATIT